MDYKPLQFRGEKALTPSQAKIQDLTLVHQKALKLEMQNIEEEIQRN